MEAKLKKVVLIVGAMCFVCWITWQTTEPRLLGFFRYRGCVELAFPQNSEVLFKKKSNTVSERECYSLLSRVAKEEGSSTSVFTIWEDRKYIYCKDGIFSGTWYNMAIPTNVVQIRRQDAKWRRGNGEWKDGGYVHLREKQLVHAILSMKNIDDVNNKFGIAYRNAAVPVLVEPGERFQGILVTNRMVIHNSDDYQLWCYDCIDGTIDVVVKGKDEVVWCAPVKWGKL